jgi:hypothetical protein
VQGSGTKRASINIIASKTRQQCTIALNRSEGSNAKQKEDTKTQDKKTKKNKKSPEI